MSYKNFYSKKPLVIQKYQCPNPFCKQNFPLIKGLQMHFIKSPSCMMNFKNKICKLHDGNRLHYLDNRKTFIQCIQQSYIKTLSRTDNYTSNIEEHNDDTNALVNIDESNTIESLQSDTTMLLQKGDIECILNTAVAHTDIQWMQTKLLKILNDAKAPLYLYGQIMTWIKETHLKKFKSEDYTVSRYSMIKQLENCLNLNPCIPKSVNLCLPYSDGLEIDVVTFDFENMVTSLLTDIHLVSDINNFDINPINPFDKYKNNSNLLSVVNSGTWYRNAYNECIRDPEKEFLLPICFACDKTHIQKSGKASCWPLLFSTTLFNQKLRNKSIAWRPLGYIHDTSIYLSKSERHGSQLSSIMKSDQLHRIFECILKSYIHVQRKGGIQNFRLRIGSYTKKVTLKVPTCFIIGDMVGGDNICSSVASYRSTASRLCRKCDVRGINAGNPYQECNKIEMGFIRYLVENNHVEELADLDQYPIHNAWFDVCFGGCPYGIFSAACPVEPLHSLEVGIISDCLNILFHEKMNGSKRSILDRYSKKLLKLPRQRYINGGTTEDVMPRLLWKDGICSLTDITASNRVGIMITVLIISLTDNGKDLLQGFMGSAFVLKKMQYVFMKILCYWSWLKRTSYWHPGDEEKTSSVKNCISKMLFELKRYWPRHSGQGWNTAKFHEQLHVPDDINRYGAPRNYHTGPAEHNHIDLVKNHAKMSQQNRHSLDLQIATRWSEDFVLRNAHNRMSYYHQDASTISSCEVPKNDKSSKGWVYIRNEGDKYEIISKGWCDNSEQLFFEDIALNCLWTICPNGNCTKVELFTEYKRNGVLFRAHPNFRKSGPWYDWVMIRYERNTGLNGYNEYIHKNQVYYMDNVDNPEKYEYAPGMILAFASIEEEYYAIVKTCQSKCSKDTLITTLWRMDFVDRNNTIPFVLPVNVESIVRHCVMIPTNEQEDLFQEIWFIERWGDMFYKLD